MNKSLLLYVLKNAIGATIAILLAQFFELKNVMTAGVIVLLSVQNTKMESVKIALKRFGATIIALIMAPIIFQLLDFNPFSFGVFLALYLPILILLGLQDGIVVNSVLVTHLLIDEDISFNFLLNETWIMLIGLSIALILNLYMPSVEGQLKNTEKEIEDLIGQVLSYFSDRIIHRSNETNGALLFESLTDKLQDAIDQAHLYTNNNLFVKEDYHIAYVYMRKQQTNVLLRIHEYLLKLSMSYLVSLKVSDFTKRTSNSIGIKNKATDLLLDLDELRELFKSWELPKTREEFENRALLFQFLNDMEIFLNIKKAFHAKYNVAK